ncbi:helix-turn-helix domain-containing protein [Chryseobacterium chendengshani]|uniref:helix-turn-helix domain-containing protein n=1 Tax=Chryseobacterium sp. LJ668 TaxID=2864040 RepID=UPI001C68AF9E|nr:helix-turn-helix domain-containing protein [Chryseobacterium sp. LJ668]MBW8523869.1 helix-turn-helix domain-containing protein [Chryseobacterium sp. LJ668]QYK16810.1 helix-turn-helix domain-containing protein [Chryseobacterium sp. LJ668]
MSSNIKITRICQHCGHEFIAKTTVTKHCSDNCAKRAYKARIKKQKIEESDAKTKIIRERPQIHVKTFEYLTVNDVATLLKCDRRTVHNMIKLGRLNAINLSTRKTRVLKKDLDGMFLNPIREVNTQQPLPNQDKRPPLKDCYTVGQILAKYSLAEVTLRNIVSKNNIAKYKEGKYVYIKKQTIDPILKRFDIRY